MISMLITVFKNVIFLTFFGISWNFNPFGAQGENSNLFLCILKYALFFLIPGCRLLSSLFSIQE